MPKRSPILLAVLAVGVVWGQGFGWHEMASLPWEPSGRGCYSGAWLATMERDGRPFIYAAKGRWQGDFYCYDVEGDLWLALGPIPWGAESLGFSIGSRGVTDGRRFIYATEGNETFGFWMYDAHEDWWIRLPDLPRQPDTFGVRRADLAYVELGGKWVYLLWSADGNFARYNVYRRAWEVLPSAPDGGTSWQRSPSLVYDGHELLYAYKTQYEEMWVFDLWRQAWLPERLHGAPGRGQGYEMSGYGSSAAWHLGSIYLLKGNNSNEFWRYCASGDSWVQLDTIPTFGSTGREKPVSKGGYLASVGGGVFCALKGNKTVEFWRFGPPVGVEEKPGLKDECGGMSQSICRVMLRLPGKQNAALLDITGRRVTELQPGANDIRHVAPGIYFVRQKGPRGQGFERSSTRKLVVQR
ncbi:MAG: hypothetical protein JSU73_13370 [candidate division WOR-3 bacterium]|nr:MAG: hypothetical protein JSU73_13370 [candidate division WOR-3 bacterium]